MHDAQDTASNTVNIHYKLNILFCNSVFVIKTDANSTFTLC